MEGKPQVQLYLASIGRVRNSKGSEIHPSGYGRHRLQVIRSRGREFSAYRRSIRYPSRGSIEKLPWPVSSEFLKLRPRLRIHRKSYWGGWTNRTSPREQDQDVLCKHRQIAFNRIKEQNKSNKRGQIDLASLSKVGAGDTPTTATKAANSAASRPEQAARARQRSPAH